MSDSGHESEKIDLLYEGFVSRSLISLDEKSANKYLQLYIDYECEQANAHKYWIDMMGLALCAKNTPMLSLLYCLSEGMDSEADFLEICEKGIQASNIGYSYRVGDLQKTFEYMLTQEKPEEFMTILGCAANVLRTKQDEKIYFKLKDNKAEKIEADKIVTFIISEYNKERAWKLLAEYTYKSKKVTLNFIANSVWFLRFKDTAYALNNCINVLERYADNSFPGNFLWCCLSIWNSNTGKPIEGYKTAFIEHIRRCKSFQNADSDVVEQWYHMLCAQKKPEQSDFFVAIEIAKQSDSFGAFYKMFMKEETAYKLRMSHDIASFIRFCSAFVYCSDDESFHEALVDIRELRNQIGSFCISKNDRSALMWLDDLMANRNAYRLDDYFAEASMEVLSSYPKAPSKDVVSKWITSNSSHRLPNYDLLRNWINTFGNMRIVNNADYAITHYISKNYLPEDNEERENFFRIRLFLSEKYIVFFDRFHQSTNDDYLSIMYCKIVEKMLKRYHADIYQKRLPNASTELKFQGKKVSFGDFSNPQIKKKLKNRLTLGAFLFPINPAYPNEASYAALARTESKKKLWKEHGAMLSDVTEIRNMSAHGVVGSIVDSALLHKLKSTLFEDEG